jgi:ribosomal protein L40E
MRECFPAVQEEVPLNPIVCARCNVPLDYVGSKRFHEGTRWGALGDIGELFVKKERFDVSVCPRCGGVELFVDGIGDELRPGEKKS